MDDWRFPVLALGSHIVLRIYVGRSKKLWEKNSLIIELADLVFVLALLLNAMMMGLRSDGQASTKNTAANNVTEYLESIRHNEAALIAFFQAMPKGADLHNHFTGAIYAETFLEDVISKGYFIHPDSLKIMPDGKRKGYLPLSEESKKKSFSLLRQRLFQDWSIKDYYPGFSAPDQHFFDAFGKFPEQTDEDSRKGLQELLNRAASENVQYLELMTGGPKYRIDSLIYENTYTPDDELIRTYMSRGQTDRARQILNKWFDLFQAKGNDSVSLYLKKVRSIHYALDTTDCAIRYLIQGKRESRPAELFSNLVTAFMAADRDSLIAGINLVNREDGPIAMKDYQLHMQMFKFLHGKFNDVRYSLHAGELTLGLVRPEHLRFHINEAVFTAGAARIGHGVDLPYENDRVKLLSNMQQKKIAVEINLWSNDFILGVRNGQHPIMMYHEAGVPIVISTDDAGILRSNMTHQFVLLASRYPALTYTDIKEFVRNSIVYSFIREPKLKEKQLKELDQRFIEFENSVK